MFLELCFGQLFSCSHLSNGVKCKMFSKSQISLISESKIIMICIHADFDAYFDPSSSILRDCKNLNSRIRSAFLNQLFVLDSPFGKLAPCQQDTRAQFDPNPSAQTPAGTCQRSDAPTFDRNACMCRHRLIFKHGWNINHQFC